MRDRQVLLSEITDFRQLFWGMVPWHETEPKTLHQPHIWCVGRETMQIGNYCMVNGGSGLELGHQAMKVGLNGIVIDAIKDNALFIDRDTMHFDVIVFPSGLCHVKAQHGLIIGGWYLTQSVRVDTLPSFIRTTPKESTNE